MRPASDRSLIRSVDRALAEAARKCGAWLVCHPGCTECCKGPFSITQLDALRLSRGLEKLAKRAPRRAARVRAAAARATGDDDFCPALDPATGRCDLYAARPITCRTFGPPVRCGAEAVGICELCFKGASDAEIAACEVEIDAAGLEAALLEELQRTRGLKGGTTVAEALR
jgi:Fe-S-cluster containining protein